MHINRAVEEHNAKAEEERREGKCSLPLQAP